MSFTKMQGLGNDYLFVFGEVPENAGEISGRLSDRRRGAGADGMIYITPSSAADFGMRIFNSDGSEAETCGNGIRCLGKYVFDRGLTKKTRLTVETPAGIKKLDLHTEKGKVTSVSVEMGRADVSEEIELTVHGRTVVCVPVSVGNPHAVVFTDDPDAVPLEELGREICGNPAFPEGVNVEFVRVLPTGDVRMRVRERGSGITPACGTGACAAVAAAVRRGYIRPGTPVSVILDGGRLTVAAREDGETVLTGPAETVYEGTVEV
ncbi:MAG: diaminopimelate epimerase [Clostridia bacterium]|nr:diaminopimelate epimerase [Clostridia bacterium]